MIPVLVLSLVHFRMFLAFETVELPCSLGVADKAKNRKIVPHQMAREKFQEDLLKMEETRMKTFGL